jgi:uncharacterized protein YbjQ (UPF0145 family)
MDYENCPTCNKSLKGIFSSELVTPTKTDFINKHLNLQNRAYCSSCSKKFIDKIAKSFLLQKKEIETRLEQIIHYVPVISSPAPIKWEYEIIGMVSAQTTSGTGFSAELSQSFNDFFGKTSKTTNRKIERATTLCKANLRVQCVQNGGNAVISTDIDFNEIGAGNTNMLMVCMAGTAIKVTDMSNFNPKSREFLAEIVELTERLEAIADIGHS